MGLPQGLPTPSQLPARQAGSPRPTPGAFALQSEPARHRVAQQAASPLHAALEVGLGQLAARLAVAAVFFQALEVLLLDLLWKEGRKGAYAYGE